MKWNLIRVDPLHPDPADHATSRAYSSRRRIGSLSDRDSLRSGRGHAGWNPKAIARIFEVKGRPEAKPLPVQVDSTEQVSAFMTERSAGKHSA